ncbi:MAG: ATP-binding protein, partial [Flavobacteriaceae bacterium]
LKGSINDCKIVDGKLYAMSNLGGFVMDSKAARNTGRLLFEPIEGLDTNASALLITKFGLLGCADRGTFIIKNEKVVKISSRACSGLVASEVDAKRIWALNSKGIFSLYYNKDNWVTEGYLKDYKNVPHLITPLANGDFWVSTRGNGVDYVTFPKSPNNKNLRDSPIIKNYNTLRGLPNLKDNVAFKLGVDIAFATRNGLYRYDQVSDIFVPNNLLGSKYTERNTQILWSRLDDQGSIWVYSKLGGTADLVKGKIYNQNIFEYSSIPFNRFVSSSAIFGTSQGPDQNTFFYGEDGIIQYYGGSKDKIQLEVPALVRKVTLNDSVLYWGYKRKPSILPFGKNSMIFECSIANFDEVSANKYQYQLEGYDTRWSDWTMGTKKEYTNLPEGNYRFRVRAKNIYNLISKEGYYHFQILPPWYHSWLAYILYILLFAGFMWIILRWRSRQLKSKNEALEKLIAVRTSEVQHQANQLKIQAEKLQELDKAKSRFFANISHEFRTPLTLIKGPIEQLEQNFSEKLNIETVKMIRRNANRLLNMVNQLLDLSKIDEGGLELAPAEGDVYKCLRTASSSFNSLAAQRNMDFRLDIPPTVLWALFDRDKLENIIYNLLGNAFKFSGDGSKITFVADYTENGLRLQVSDSGKGISAEKLPYIFDRFYQADSSNTRENVGSGIGLSLSKDLVELMNGTIIVSSEVGKGTFFTVQLPIQEIKTIQMKAVDDVHQVEQSMIKKPFVLPKTDKRNLPTILLVEDNSDMRHFITEQMVKFYKVMEAVNGEVGLQKAIADSPDLVITDLMMPKMDGIELCKKLKTDVHTSHIPVIMLTAKAGLDNKLEGLETGADDYLTKPFDSNELLVRTKNLIEQRKRLRELFSRQDVKIDPKKVTVTSIDQKFLEQVLELLETNFSNPDFGVPQMQDSLAMSKTQLHRKIKALTNEAPGELLRNFRLKMAAQLLAQKADSVTQIAYKVGFNNLSYFAKCFKELYGVAPSSF